ncbi:MAG: stage II sporulation protein M [Chitinophagaceae bacterium]|nr:stage II sporulation protein M [Chitinophagaceae bacterium]
MREAQFLKQNAEKWKQYEQEALKPESPDTFADRFIELTDDLAYSKTFYPNSNTTKYLNGLASRFHQKIYRNKKERSSRIISFWQYELPWIFKQYHRQLLYAFLFFIVACFLGALSAYYDDSILRVITGDAYVNQTTENIGKGDPFGIYKTGGQFNMFTMIAINNIKVAIFAFVFGIFFSIGTVLLLVQNGMMVGAFIQFFFARNLGAASILAIFIHGTIELSVIVIAGCSGLILGSSILFPKTYSRWHSLQKGGRHALKIVLGLVPFFILAAFLEGFVTRHYQVIPLWLNILILAGSLLLIVWYFIIYPLRLHKRVALLRENLNKPEDQNFILWLNKKLNSDD